MSETESSLNISETSLIYLWYMMKRRLNALELITGAGILSTMPSGVQMLTYSDNLIKLQHKIQVCNISGLFTVLKNIFCLLSISTRNNLPTPKTVGEMNYVI